MPPHLEPGGSWPPLRLTDGRTVPVPTRHPAALTAALLDAVPDTRDGHTGTKGTLGS